MDKLNIKVRNPYSTLGDLNFTLPIDATVLILKTEISKTTPQNPTIDSQKLIYAGRMLRDLNEKLTDFLPKNDTNTTHTFHLILATTPQGGQRSAPNNIPVNNTHNGFQPFNMPHHQYPAQMFNFNPAFQRAGPIPAQPNVQPIVAFQINFSLLIKLAFLVFILSQGAGMSKLILFTIAALVIYLYQTGRLPRFGGPNPNPNPDPPVRPVVPMEGPAPDIRQRKGLVDEVKDIIFPFVYSLFPGWKPPVNVIPGN